MYHIISPINHWIWIIGRINQLSYGAPPNPRRGRKLSSCAIACKDDTIETLRGAKERGASTDVGPETAREMAGFTSFTWWFRPDLCLEWGFFDGFKEWGLHGITNNSKYAIGLDWTWFLRNILLVVFFSNINCITILNMGKLHIENNQLITLSHNK